MKYDEERRLSMQISGVEAGHDIKLGDRLEDRGRSAHLGLWIANAGTFFTKTSEVLPSSFWDVKVSVHVTSSFLPGLPCVKSGSFHSTIGLISFRRIL
jgi:hypothetical protein